jgi:hypothetical protein
MASTRNKNTRTNYEIEQRNFDLANQYTFNPHSAYGLASSTHFPGMGLNPAQIPHSQLSHNPVNVESYLLGIDSTNLVKPRVYEEPELKHLDSVNFIERIPVILPEPLVIEKNQRPMRK